MYILCTQEIVNLLWDSKCQDLSNLHFVEILIFRYFKLRKHLRISCECDDKKSLVGAAPSLTFKPPSTPPPALTEVCLNRWSINLLTKCIRNYGIRPATDSWIDFGSLTLVITWSCDWNTISSPNLNTYLRFILCTYVCTYLPRMSRSNQWTTIFLYLHQVIKLFICLSAFLTLSFSYNSQDAVGDLVAGITVGLTVIPQAIAYSGIAGLPPAVSNHLI